MALIVHYHTAVPASKRTIDAERPVIKPGKTKDCGCGGKDAQRKYPSYTTAQLEKFIAEGSGNAEMEAEVAARKAGASIQKVTPQIAPLGSRKAKDAAAKLTRDAGEPVNAAWLKLDRMTPDSLAREARSKGVKDETKTGQVMGILRAQFKPNQIEAWSQHF